MPYETFKCQILSSGFTKTFCTSLDILTDEAGVLRQTFMSDDPGAPRQTFLKIARHVRRDRRISGSLCHNQFFPVITVLWVYFKGFLQHQGFEYEKT